MTAAVSVRKQLPWLRSRAGLSQRELSERVGLGLTRSVIANLETGRKADLTVDQLIALCAALGCHAIDIVPALAPDVSEVIALRARLSEIAELAVSA